MAARVSARGGSDGPRGDSPAPRPAAGGTVRPPGARQARPARARPPPDRAAAAGPARAGRAAGLRGPGPALPLPRPGVPGPLPPPWGGPRGGRGPREAAAGPALAAPGPPPFAPRLSRGYFAAARRRPASRFPAAALPPRFPAEWRRRGSPALPALRLGVARPRSLATVSRWRDPAGAMDVGELLSYQVSGPAAAAGVLGGAGGARLLPRGLGRRRPCPAPRGGGALGARGPAPGQPRPFLPPRRGVASAGVPWPVAPRAWELPARRRSSLRCGRCAELGQRPRCALAAAAFGGLSPRLQKSGASVGPGYRGLWGNTAPLMPVLPPLACARSRRKAHPCFEACARLLFFSSLFYDKTHLI